ncbi:MAG TPA: hypothetical protein VFE47_13140 [Tepidisphaeraceae bacterium]|jgi:hypothetical protein|nr:hypothetical protein [Tepidisphaeraceae bacterium]
MARKSSRDFHLTPEQLEARLAIKAKKVAHLPSSAKAAKERAMFAPTLFDAAAPACLLNPADVDTLVLSVVKSFNVKLNITIGTDLEAIGISEALRENYQSCIVKAMNRSGCGLTAMFTPQAVGACTTVKAISKLTFKSRI